MSDASISLAGSRALVTGAASGIGAAIASRFAAVGARGVGLDIAAPGSLPTGWGAVTADVRHEDAVAHACAEAARQLGGELDLLVAAAGIVPPWRRVDELDLDEWDEVFAVNVRGIAATFKHAAPLIADGGAIVAIASLNSWRGDPNLATYVASKHAVLGIVRSAAIDLGRRGIRVNAVGPGPIATEALRSRIERRAQAGGPALEDALAAAAAQTSLGRIATTDDVAGATLFLASGLAGGITGQLLPVDAGLP